MNLMKTLGLSLLLLGAFACGPSDSGKEVLPSFQLSQKSTYSVEAKWVRGPVFGDHINTVELTIFAPNRKMPKTTSLIRVHPWMKIHGHGTKRKIPTIKHLHTNVFEVTDLYFTMAGPWELNLKAEVNGQVDDLEFKVQVPE